jgi:hypothetical protein
VLELRDYGNTVTATKAKRPWDADVTIGANAYRRRTGVLLGVERRKALMPARLGFGNVSAKVAHRVPNLVHVVLESSQDMRPASKMFFAELSRDPAIRKGETKDRTRWWVSTDDWIVVSWEPMLTVSGSELAARVARSGRRRPTRATQEMARKAFTKRPAWGASDEDLEVESPVLGSLRASGSGSRAERAASPKAAKDPAS